MAEQLIFTQETIVVSGPQPGSQVLQDTRLSQQSLTSEEFTTQILDSSGSNTNA